MARLLVIDYRSLVTGCAKQMQGSGGCRVYLHPGLEFRRECACCFLLVLPGRWQVLNAREFI